MKNILVFAASNSSKSINQKLAHHAGEQLKNFNVSSLDLNDYEMPIYSSDREEENGIPEEAKKFASMIKKADGIIISFAEHNGSYSAAFKNVLDWVSRHDQKAWTESQMLLMATSPGGHGASSVLNTAVTSFPYFGAKILASFSLPSFYQSFSQEEGIKDNDLKSKFQDALNSFVTGIN